MARTRFDEQGTIPVGAKAQFNADGQASDAVELVPATAFNIAMPRSSKVSTENVQEESSADFDAVVSVYGTSKVTSNSYIVAYFFVALFVSSCPTYLFWSVFDLTMANFGMVFVPVVIMSSLLLTFAYRNWALNTFATLSNSRRSSGKKKNELEAITVSESVVWSFFINNLLFFLIFLFVAFYVLKQLAPSYSYTLSMTITSAIVWQLSSVTQE